MNVTREVLGYKELLSGCKAFVENEPRDAMYRVAIKILDSSWGNFPEMTDGLGVLLLTWNQALYRYEEFDFQDLEDCIRKSWRDIEGFKVRDIDSLTSLDEAKIKKLFDNFLDALRTTKAKSPVATAKAIHLLCPSFFPLWDNDISKAYGTPIVHGDSAGASTRYVGFMWKIKTDVDGILTNYMSTFHIDRATSVQRILRLHPRYKPYLTMLKLIDEYNYAKFHAHYI